MSKKKLLKEMDVIGNLRDYTQRVEIYYYPEEKKKKDKIAIYFLLTDGEKEYAKRSVFFKTIADLSQFIKYCIQAYAYFLKKRGKVGQENYQIVASYLAKAWKEAFLRGLRL